MNARKGLVLDANILIRAVFGFRVRQLLESYEDLASFYSRNRQFMDASEKIRACFCCAIRRDKRKRTLSTISSSEVWTHL